MENREVEEILKQNYNSVKKQSFDQRFSRISSRLNMPQGQPQQVFVAESQPALAGVGGGTNVDYSSRHIKFAFIIPIMLFLIISFVCVFMWVNNDSNRNGYSINIADLIFFNTTEEEFTEVIEQNDFNLIERKALSEYIYSYSLFTDMNSEVHGGRLWFENNDIGYMGNIDFYTLNVTGINEVTEPYQTYTTTSGTEVNYTVSGGGEADPLYNTVASATYKNMNYYIEYTSLNNDALEFFNAIFA